MPELPDVEGFRRYLARHAAGRRIVSVHMPDTEIVRNRSPQAFGRAVRGTLFGTPARHGKWLIAPLTGSADDTARARANAPTGTPAGDTARAPANAPTGTPAGDTARAPANAPTDPLADPHPALLMHFGMTGLLRWSDTDADRHPHDRVIFVCDGGELRYNNMRRFGGLWLARDERERDEVTGPLGPDAATLDQDEFERLLAPRRGAIKAALMDQRLLAGVGNLLSDEILWRARIHPETPVRSLTPAQRRAVHGALRAAVSESTRYGRVPHGRRWLTRVRDDRNATCPRCATPVRRATVAGRTACWCPRCQR